MRVTFNEHDLSILGAFVEHNRKMFGAVQDSIIGIFLAHPGLPMIPHLSHDGNTQTWSYRECVYVHVCTHLLQ